MKFCKKCESNQEVESHHVWCKFMNNKKGLGIKIDFCKKCHTILHLIIPSIVWKYIREEDKPKIIKEIAEFTNFYSLNNKNSQKTIYDNQKTNKRCRNCDYELDEEDFIERYCPFCYSSIEKINGDLNDKRY